MKLVVFISFLLMLSLCSSGFGEGHEIADNDLYSSNKVEELYSDRMMDYPPTGPNPGHDPTVPPPPPSDEENMMENYEGDEVAENKVEELYGHKMMDYPGPHPDPRDNPPPPPPPTDEENIMENSVN
ncbi:unnamed protein product [Brassica oleracea var. botrytis]|uniref:Uncharacterized protein n=2 Tax=Brassica oleracea TaxID=3712 RepID=A0A0D3DRK8_BRAOL|nr:unnamed protein product [Brassica oleracea]